MRRYSRNQEGREPRDLDRRQDRYSRGGERGPLHTSRGGGTHLGKRSSRPSHASTSSSDAGERSRSRPQKRWRAVEPPQRDSRGGSSNAVSALHGATAPTMTATRETDPRRLSQRQKQIDFGKNTIGYDRYAAAVPRAKRIWKHELHPVTPKKDRIYSKRQWDGAIKSWRRRLHQWDEKNKSVSIAAPAAGAAASSSAAPAAAPAATSAATSAAAAPAAAPAAPAAVAPAPAAAALPLLLQVQVSASASAPAAFAKPAAPTAPNIDFELDDLL